MTALGNRIRSQAAIADRPGQMADLERIADEVDAAIAALTKRADDAETRLRNKAFLVNYVPAEELHALQVQLDRAAS